MSTLLQRQVRRAAALLEVFGVYLAGSLLTDQLIRHFGIAATNPLDTLSVNTSGSELVTSSRQLLVLYLFQYGGYFLLIIPINWWYRRTGLRDYRSLQK